MNTDLTKEVWSEQGMMELLGCTKEQLRRLTLEGGLPAVRLERGLYVYMAGPVLGWLAARKSGRGATVSRAEEGVTTP